MPNAPSLRKGNPQQGGRLAFPPALFSGGGVFRIRSGRAAVFGRAGTESAAPGAATDGLSPSSPRRGTGNGAAAHGYSMKTYDTVIFDLDGTLLYTLDDLTISVNHALSGFTDVRRSVDEVRGFVGNGIRRLMELSLPGGEDNPRFEEAFAVFREHYAVHCRDHTRPYPGVSEMVAALVERGLSLGIVSNKPDREVREMNQVYFNGLFGAALGERRGVRRKPAPDTLLEAMKELGSTAGNTLYVGDSEVDILTSANASVDCLSVTWGFRSEEHLRRSGATGFIHAPAELVRYLDGAER